MVNKMIKRLKKHIGGGVQNVVIRFLCLSNLNNSFILFTGKRAKKNMVNINYCHDFKNIGDNISPLIVKYVANRCGINPEKTVSETKHLYAVGSIITAGCQDCTVWGSGLLNTRILNRLNNRTLDFRAVRGPLTRIVLFDHGFKVPPVYGDPAILMPLLFNPIVDKKFARSLITHMDECSENGYDGIHRINITTDDYETVIREIKESELIISSSLHGIILAESYGVKAILLKPMTDLFKYFDYYYSTQRFEFPIADSVEEARKIQPVDLPDLGSMRQGLIDTFPADLWA